jgi:hypothetical protein
MDPEGIGAGKSGAVIFPIQCPECPLSDWVDGIQDDVAERILGEGGMVQWVSDTCIPGLLLNVQNVSLVSSEDS